MRNSVFVASLLLCVACAPGSFNGTVAGNGLNVQDAVFMPLTYSGGLMGVMVVMADVPDVCTLMKNGQLKNATIFSVFLMSVNADYTFATPAAGDYPIETTSPSGNVAVGGSLVKIDATCTNTIATSQGRMGSGTVKVTSIKLEEGGTLSGTFDGTFGSGDKATGSFNAAYCAAFDPSTQSACE